MTVDPHQWGVATGFHDMAGRWTEAPPEAVEAILASMSATSDGPPPPATVTVRTDHPLPPLGPGRVLLEGGGELELDGRPDPGIPHGYHRFEPAGGPTHGLVVSPGRVPFPACRQWGLAAQLYAVRSARSWGIGDLADLAELCRWSSGLGAGFTLVNPLHAATTVPPIQPSPYFPASRCFMNPLYTAVENVPGSEDIETLAALAAAGRALNAEGLIQRDRVWRIKSEALELAFDRFGGDQDFERYRQARGAVLEKFAAFCGLAERHGPDWRRWPASCRHPDGGVAELARSRDGRRRMLYHAWLQWVLDTQLAVADGELGLVADLAVGVDPGGPDSWIWQDVFSEGMRVGAPPDDFNTRGQDWGLPPFDPWRLRSAAYEPWIQALRAGMRHGSGLRVDHVMGLFRLYWIPAGSDSRSGAYVRYPHHDMLNILALEAERAGAYVVGEDLGTVEDDVRRELAERRVLSYRVWWFEEAPTPSWPKAALGTVTTHDLPTIAGVLTGSDLEAQRRLGMEPNEESSRALAEKLEGRTGLGRDSPVERVISAVHRDLARAPSMLLAAALEDVLAVEERPNMPGTVDGWPNWSIALPLPLEDLEKVPFATEIAGHLSGG